MYTCVYVCIQCIRVYMCDSFCDDYFRFSMTVVMIGGW